MWLVAFYLHLFACFPLYNKMSDIIRAVYEVEFKVCEKNKPGFTTFVGIFGPFKINTKLFRYLVHPLKLSDCKNNAVKNMNHFSSKLTPSEEQTENIPHIAEFTTSHICHYCFLEAFQTNLNTEPATLCSKTCWAPYRGSISRHHRHRSCSRR